MRDDVTEFVTIRWLSFGLLLGEAFIAGFVYAMGFVFVAGVIFMKVRDGNMPVTQLE